MIDFDTLTEKQQKRYHRILRLSEEIIYAQGFHKLTLTELTQKLSLSRSTIYEYFGSKEGLVEKIVMLYNERLNAGLSDIIHNQHLATYDKFLAISKQLAANSPSRNMFYFHNDLKVHIPELYEMYLAGRAERVKKIYRPLIEEGIKHQLFDSSISPDFLLQTYLKSSQMICETDMMEKSDMSKEAAMETITKIFLKGAKKIN